MKLQRAEGREDAKDGQRESEITYAVDDEGFLGCVASLLPVDVIADE
jgi:hypothetical protein